MLISMIVCTDEKFGISKNEKIPWNIPEDMKFFKETIIGSTLIMGRKTFKSIGSKSLPETTSIVISSTVNEIICKRTLLAKSLKEALELADKNKPIFIIGGSGIYNETMREHLCHKIYLNLIRNDFLCDNFIDNPTKHGYIKQHVEFLQTKNGFHLEKGVYYLV
jgi:dihydrofolate reductase